MNTLILTSGRVMDLFKDWDDDKSNTVSEKEFIRALDGMGFDTPTSVIKKLFAKFDPDKSGTLKYDELTEMLDKTVGDDMTKINLLNAPEQPNRDGKGSKPSGAADCEECQQELRGGARPRFVQRRFGRG